VAAGVPISDHRRRSRGGAVRHERSLVSRRTRGGQQVRLGAWGDPSLIVSCCPDDFLYIEHSFSVYLSNTIRDPC
jgi:hypothetical protein